MYIRLCRSNPKRKIFTSIIGSSNNVMTKGKRVLCSGKTGLRRSARSKSQPNKKKRKRTTNYDKYERALEEAVVARRVSKKTNKKMANALLASQTAARMSTTLLLQWHKRNKYKDS